MWAVLVETTAPQRGSTLVSAVTFAPVPLNTGNASVVAPKCSRSTSTNLAV
jgi:hypothetical protein